MKKITEKELGKFIASEILSILESAFKPIGGIAGFTDLISSYQAQAEKRVHRPIRYPLIMPTVFSGTNHK